MDPSEKSDPFAGLGVNLPSGRSAQLPQPSQGAREAAATPSPRKPGGSPRRRGPVSREVAFHLVRAERPSRERSVLELFVDGMADVAADLHTEGRLPQVQTQDGPLPGRRKP
jgi:hypothetical protein